MKGGQASHLPNSPSSPRYHNSSNLQGFVKTVSDSKGQFNTQTPGQTGQSLYEAVTVQSEPGNSNTFEKNRMYVNEQQKQQKAKLNKWNKIIFILAGAIVLALLMISGLAVAVAVLGQQQETKEEQNKTPEQILEKALQDTIQQVKQLQPGFAIVDDGWTTPLNGFKYKYLGHYPSWNQSRISCQAEGGDIASYGMRSFGIRRYLVGVLPIGSNFWIGLNNLHDKSNWRWETNLSESGWFPADSSNSFFAPGEPSTSSPSIYHCAYVSSSTLLTYDGDCEWWRSVLCEKRHD